MAINDIITVGATPLSVHAYWATGGSDWFADEARARDLVNGWKRACDRCGVSWGGGETPALAGVVEPGRVDLAASCVGIVRPKSRLTLGDKLAAGDAIVLLGSSGIHANGISLARKLAERLPDGYATRLEDGTLLGDALLEPTLLYSPVTEALADAGVVPHYCVNITGHGWRKLMRHRAPFTYQIDVLPPVPPVLQFIRQHAAIDDREAYGNLNMGAGFALVRCQRRRRTHRPGRAQCGSQRTDCGPCRQRFQENRHRAIATHFQWRRPTRARLALTSDRPAMFPRSVRHRQRFHWCGLRLLHVNAFFGPRLAVVQELCKLRGA